jgi:predicted ATPase
VLRLLQEQTCDEAFSRDETSVDPVDRRGRILGVVLHRQHGARGTEELSTRESLNNPNLFVISGGPGAGKTSVLQELGHLGFHTAPEVARQIIQEQVNGGGTALPWQDRQAYTELMLQRSIESYLRHTPASRPTFCDRGIPDSLCYARLVSVSGADRIQRACEQYHYADVVFLAPPWKEIYTTDTERKQDFCEAERTFAVMKDVYQTLGYEIVELPKGSPSARARFVLAQLNLTKSLR